MSRSLMKLWKPCTWFWSRYLILKSLYLLLKLKKIIMLLIITIVIILYENGFPCSYRWRILFVYLILIYLNLPLNTITPNCFYNCLLTILLVYFHFCVRLLLHSLKLVIFVLFSCSYLEDIAWIFIIWNTLKTSTLEQIWNNCSVGNIFFKFSSRDMQWYTTQKLFVFGVILVGIFPHLGWIWRHTSYLLRIQSICGKMPTRITPNTGTFYAVVVMNVSEDDVFLQLT